MSASTHRATPKRPVLRDVIANVACAVVYYAGARLGLALAFAYASVSPVWPPTGIALAAVYLAGRRVAPGIFAGALVANLAVLVGELHAAPAPAVAAAATIACGNTAEALLGVALWRRLVHDRDPFARVADLLRMFAAIPVACLVSATVGMGGILLGGATPSSLPEAWMTWWLGDVTGGIVLAPVLLLWGRGKPRRPSGSAWVAFVATVGLTLVVFGTPAIAGPPKPLSYLLLLPLLWIAFRHGLRETATAVVLVCALAIWATLGGRGPFVLETVNASLLVLQTFVAVVTVTVLSLGAALAERRESERKLRELAEDLEERVSTRTDELSRVNQQLQQAQKMEAIGTLAGGIAHDFNNLLTTIRLGTQMGRRALAPESPEGESLAMAEAASQQAADLVAQFLTLGRKRTPRKHRLDLREVVSSTCKLLRRSLPSNIDVIEVLGDETLPVDGDDAQLGQALLNLGINARDAMPEGGLLTLRTNFETLDAASAALLNATHRNYVVLHVRDTGQGMDADTLQHIFEPFFTTKEPERGTGLGLAMVYACIRDHGGFIRTDSQKGTGTCFDLWIPRADGLPSEGAAPAHEAPSEIDSHAEGSILVVDDDTAVLRATALMLRNQGYDVKTAGDAQAALAALRADPRKVDLILTDLVMPGLSGRELLKAVRAEEYQTPIVLMSGYGAPDDPGSIVGEGFAGFVPKPFALADLTRVVREALAAEGESDTRTPSRDRLPSAGA